METLTAVSTSPELGVRASVAAPVIVATDGLAQSDAALAMARIFAEGVDALRVVTVLKTLPVLSEAAMAMSADLETARQATARREVTAQLRRILGEEPHVEVLAGDPASMIAQHAHASGATMIVSGLGRHRVSDRVFADETALRLMRMADAPVFAACANANEAPRRIVIAIDFSETSLRAARLALELAAPGATLYLAHVAPRDSSLYEWQGWGRTYRQDAGDALQKVREQLRVPRDMTMQKVLLQGDTATELLAFATSVNADLIATGSHGRGFVARMLIGSVATRIVRASTCSVLTVPHAAAMTKFRTTAEPPSVVGLEREEWVDQLDAFTRRNFGRRGTLEVDDPEIDAQAQEFDYPFLGATYDVHDQRLELMFGEPGGHSRRHLTRGISGVTSVDVLRDDRGRDIAIRIAHGPGQTVLTFST